MAMGFCIMLAGLGLWVNLGWVEGKGLMSFIGQIFRTYIMGFYVMGINCYQYQLVYQFVSISIGISWYWQWGVRRLEHNIRVRMDTNRPEQ